MAYATATAIKEYLKGINLSALGDETPQDDAMDSAAEVATAQVDQFTRRTFTATTATRTFDGSGTSRLFIPDLLALTGWTLDGPSQSASELLLYPLSGPPATWLLRKTGVFPRGNGNVTVTGSWGFAESLPDPVAKATAQWGAADVLLRIAGATDSGTTAVTQGSLAQRYTGGAYADEIRRLNASAEGLLGPFRRPLVK